MARAPEEAEEEEDSQVGEELKTFQSVSAWYNFLAMDRPDFLYSVKDFVRKMASPSSRDLVAFKRVARYTIKHPKMVCRYPRTELDNKNIGVFGRAACL